VLGWDRARFLTDRHHEAPTGFQDDYDRLVARRALREPTSYIAGVREFWGLDFEVTGDVLIPRPETEFLVEEALACIRALPSGGDPPLVVDVGTGSGCVAVVLAHEVPRIRLVATDISIAALKVARRNAARHGLASRIRFVCADLLTGLDIVPHVMTCNPPYVPQVSAPGLSPEVREFEPHVALFGGADGLEKQRSLLEQAATRLEPSSTLIVEFGDGQEDAVFRAVAEWPCFEVIKVRNDLQDIPRTMVIRRR
jgi:release factor glutamine methyltransferase